MHTPHLSPKEQDNLIEGLWYLCIACAFILLSK